MGAIEDENVRLVKAMYDALARGDLDTLMGMLDDEMDLEVHGPLTVPFAGRFQGRAAIEEFFAIVGEHTAREEDDPIPKVNEVLAQGNKVVAIGVDRVRSKKTGKYYDGWWVHVMELREGKVIRLREFIDTASAHMVFQHEAHTNGVDKPQ